MNLDADDIRTKQQATSGETRRLNGLGTNPLTPHHHPPFVFGLLRHFIYPNWGFLGKIVFAPAPPPPPPSMFQYVPGRPVFVGSTKRTHLAMSTSYAEELTKAAEELRESHEAATKKIKTEFHLLICPNGGSTGCPVPHWAHQMSMTFATARERLEQWGGYVYNDSPWTHWSDDGLHHLRFISYMEDDARVRTSHASSAEPVELLTEPGSEPKPEPEDWSALLVRFPVFTRIFRELLYWPTEHTAYPPSIHFVVSAYSDSTHPGRAHMGTSDFMLVDPDRRETVDFMCSTCLLAEPFHQLTVDKVRAWNIVDVDRSVYRHAHVSCGGRDCPSDSLTSSSVPRALQ